MFGGSIWHDFVRVILKLEACIHLDIRSSMNITIYLALKFKFDVFEL